MNACYTRDQLLEFSLGKMPESLSMEVDQHLDECPVCEETVANLDDATDSILRHVRSPQRVSQYVDEPILKQTIAQLHELDFSSLAASDESSADAQSPELSGTDTVILRDYQLERPLGRGGMGTVFLARHLRLDRPVAIKLLPERRMRDSAAVARFQREMRAVGQLDHPSIVRATDAGEVDGNYFLAMELISGADLGRLVRRCGPLDAANACELVRQAALGIEHAHQLGIVHRDLKPSNLMLTTSGHVKILDLGLALLAGVNGTVDELTTVGQLMGTLDYMAPEQLGDSHDVDQRVDVYGLGATLYKLLTGIAPYGGPEFRTPLQKLHGLANVPVPDVRGRGREVPEAVADVVHRALARDPEQRIKTAQELAEQLEPLVVGSDLSQLWRDVAERVDSLQPEGEAAGSWIRSLEHGSNKPKSKHAAEVEIQASVQPIAVSGNRRPRRWLATLAAGGLVALLGVMIVLQTNTGKLTIKSPRDDLKVQIVRGGEPFKQLTLHKGENSLRISLGEYEVVLDEKVDDLEIKDGRFTMRRGANVVATILSEGGDATNVVNDSSSDTLPVPSDDTPRFEGKTFDEWAREFQNERSLTRRGKAVEAMLALGQDGNEQRAIELIFRNTSVRDWEVGISPREGNNNSIHDLMSSHLRRFSDQSKVVNVFTNLLKTGDHSTRLLALDTLIEDTQLLAGGDLDQADLADAVLECVGDRDSKIKRRAIDLAAMRAFSLPGAERALRDLLSSADALTSSRAAMGLAVATRADDTVIDLLIKYATDASQSTLVRRNAFSGLLYAGPKAVKAVPHMIRVIEGPSNENQWFAFPFIAFMSRTRPQVPAHLQILYRMRLNDTEIVDISESAVGEANFQRQPSMRTAAVYVLGAIGPEARDAERTLLATPTSEDINWMEPGIRGAERTLLTEFTRIGTQLDKLAPTSGWRHNHGNYTDIAALTWALKAINPTRFSSVQKVISAAMPEPPKPPRLLFEGKTLEQWEAVFLTERSLPVRGPAMKAMLELARGGNERRVIESILKNLDNHTVHEIYTAETARTNLMHILREKLPTFNRQVLADVFNDLIEHDDHDTRALLFSLLFLDRDQTYVGFPIEDYLPAWTKLAQSESDFDSRLLAINALYSCADSISAVRKTIVELVQDRDSRFHYRAAKSAVKWGLENEDAIDRLINAAVDESAPAQTRSGALSALMALGVKAAKSVEAMKRIVEHPLTNVGPFEFATDDFELPDVLQPLRAALRVPSRNPSRDDENPIPVPTLHSGAIGVLVCIGPAAREAIPTLVTELDRVKARLKEIENMPAFAAESGKLRTTQQMLELALRSIDPARFSNDTSKAE